MPVEFFFAEPRFATSPADSSRSRCGVLRNPPPPNSQNFPGDTPQVGQRIANISLVVRALVFMPLFCDRLQKEAAQN